MFHSISRIASLCPVGLVPLVTLIGGLLVSPLGLFFSTEVEGEMRL